jgi:hypothetical protein
MSEIRDANETTDKPVNKDNNDIDEAQTSSKVVYAKFGAGVFEIWSLGIVIVIGGQVTFTNLVIIDYHYYHHHCHYYCCYQYFSWNAGLINGTGTYGIGVLIICIGYITLVLNISETTSGLPFAGIFKYFY